jgi:hypothetical protein
MTDCLLGLEDVVVNVLFAPFDALRACELENWWSANLISWVFVVICMVAMVYWMLQLKEHSKNNEEDKSVTSHSYL